MNREAEIAWAAGLFEGEGTFTYSPNHVRAAINMTDFEPVRRFHRIVGWGRLVEKPSHNERWRDQLVWIVSDRAGVKAVLELLRPWLSERRIAQAENALDLQAAVTSERQRYCKNGHLRTEANTHVQRRRAGEPYLRCYDCSREWKRREREARDA